MTDTCRYAPKLHLNTFGKIFFFFKRSFSSIKVSFYTFSIKEKQENLDSPSVTLCTKRECKNRPIKMKQFIIISLYLTT